MAGNPTTRRLYALGMFFAVSVLSGLLIAGLAFPLASVVGSAAKIASDSVDDLPAELEVPPRSERSQVLLADGSVMATFFNENRVNVPLDKIAPIMQQAQIAIEDKTFYKHGAINLEGIMRQLVRNSRAGEVTGGGSTLTQQYVKMVLFEKALYEGDKEAQEKAIEESIERKIRELRYAIALEKRLTKDQILEGYLNIAYYGAGAYGVESAARRYFNTTASELTIAQAALLAGLVKYPSDADPIRNPERALNRRSFVLGEMRREGYITAEQEAEANAEPFDKSKVQEIKQGCVSARYPHVCQYVKNVLLSDEMSHLGATREERENLLNRGGLTIQTVLDPKVQDATEEAIHKMVAPTDPVISTSVLIQPSTGYIVAMAQSRPQQGSEPGQSYYNYAVTRKMGGAEGYHGGSTFKLFTLAAAFEKGFPASKSYASPNKINFHGQRFRGCDGPVIARGTGNKWDVSNGGANYGIIDIAKATAQSVNTFYVQLLRDVGICESVKMAEKLGLERADGKSLLSKQFPTFVLGAVEITPLSMTEAYATIANRGVHCKPRILSSITSRDGKSIEVPPQDCQKVIEPEIADAVTKMLTGPPSYGTARAVALPRSYSQAAKTGTSAENIAIWLAGFTPELAGTAMIAVDRGAESKSFWKGRKRTLNNLRLPSGTFIRGFGVNAGQIWREAMLAGLDGRPNTKFKEPPSKILVGERVPVPSVAGMSKEQAKATLEEAGFSTAEFPQYSDRPVGTFLGISPSGTAPKFSTIMLRISRGPEPREEEPEPSPAPAQPSPGR